MINTHIDHMIVGKVYVGEFVKTRDIPEEKVIATQFYVEELDDRPVQLFSYNGNRSKEEMENWYRGKYQTSYNFTEPLDGTKWYIWRAPDNPNFLSIIKRVKQSQVVTVNNDSVDAWGFPA